MLELCKVCEKKAAAAHPRVTPDLLIQSQVQHKVHRGFFNAHFAFENSAACLPVVCPHSQGR